MRTSECTDGWLDPIRCALDRCTGPRAIFVRDDDIGWDDDRLERLLDVAAVVEVPIDLAVIPSELTDERAARLLAARDRFPARLGLHQHGWSHANLEPDGQRKSEFGPSRAESELDADLRRGRDVLRARLGDAVDPIFTPPWNRCVDSLGPLLTQAGVSVLSRDGFATRLQTAGLVECPTTIDWFAKRRGTRVSRTDWRRALAAQIDSGGTIGLLLHHAVTDDGELDDMRSVLGLLSAHPMCQFVSMVQIVSADTGRPNARQEAPTC